MHLDMLSTKRWPYLPDLDVLEYTIRFNIF